MKPKLIDFWSWRDVTFGKSGSIYGLILYTCETTRSVLIPFNSIFDFQNG